MNKLEVITLFDQDQRKNVAYPDLRREDVPNLVRHINKSGAAEGAITYSQLDQSNVENAISEQVRYFKSIGQDFEWKVYDYDNPPDLKERLRSHGFITEEPEALVVLDLQNAPEILWQPLTQDVQKILDPQKLNDVQIIEEKVWSEDSSWMQPYLGDTIRDHPEPMSVYVAYSNGEPASAAWIYFQPNSLFASLWGGSTVREFRKQGLYTALLAIRAQEAKARGIKYLTVDASPMSEPILKKFGFKRIAYSYPCKWKYKP